MQEDWEENGINKDKNIIYFIRNFYKNILNIRSTLLQKEIFDPEYGLFSLSVNKNSVYPNPISCIIPDF